MLAVEEMGLNTDLRGPGGKGTFPAEGRSPMPLLHSEDSSWRSSILLAAFHNRG
jgi:hypothetical protein